MKKAVDQILFLYLLLCPRVLVVSTTCLQANVDPLLLLFGNVAAVGLNEIFKFEGNLISRSFMPCQLFYFNRKERLWKFLANPSKRNGGSISHLVTPHLTCSCLLLATA